MDFATVRRKLANGSYPTLEQFEVGTDFALVFFLGICLVVWEYATSFHNLVRRVMMLPSTPINLGAWIGLLYVTVLISKRHVIIHGLKLCIEIFSILQALYRNFLCPFSFLLVIFDTEDKDCALPIILFLCFRIKIVSFLLSFFYVLEFTWWIKSSHKTC